MEHEKSVENVGETEHGNVESVVTEPQEKQVICGISHRERVICFEMKKSTTYLAFLFALLGELKMRIPNLYNGQTGELPNMMNIRDSHAHYEEGKNEITQVVGSERIFLMIRTPHKKRIRDFMESHCLFNKPTVKEL